ncbi:flagellar filament capping protein FliD [Halopseudomonas maritima]|uniref:flagellar filament capping protein FliD n=1 Tax=Halopseudomonas maritima TaxID=2918528 RepID=UPI001EEC49B0|nr:flagellar filament capping protein FliD [Halopseudomonas maritima]UJJ30989.1 flagellar filament capping protein FliD [Halopseudomonas maritima]
MAITGIGSGLDISSIVTALVEADGAPKSAQLTRLESSTTAKFTALGSFRSALSTFQGVLEKLNSADLYEKRSATSGDSKTFSVTADSAASVGSYDVQVFNLAQSSKVALRGQSSATDAIGTGTLTISAGDTSLDIEVSEANNSLAGIRDAINAKSADSGITATVVSDPSGGGGSRLVLSSNETGTGNDISVAVTTDASDTGDLGVLAYTPPATTDYEPTEVDPLDPLAPRVISYARDANLSIDGLSISSASNSISDAIDGVTLTLKAAQTQEAIDAGTSVKLSVGLDKSGVRTSLQSFVDGYNAMMKTINSLTSVTAVGGDDGEPLAAALVGDASVRSVVSALRTEMSSVASGDIRILADLGITTQSDGTLAIDSDKLDDALDNNFDALSNFLSGENGLMGRLDAKLEPYTKSGGIIEGRTTSLQNTLSGIDEQRERLEARLSSMETRLLAQFNAMDSLVANLSSTSTYLASQLANLPGVVKES